MLLLASLVSLIATPAGEKIPNPEQCHLPISGPILSRLTKVPPQLRKAIRTWIPDIVETGQVFQHSDYVEDKSLSARRFNVAFRSGGRWIVWYEHGGLYHTHVVAFLEGSANIKGKATKAYAPIVNLVGPPCLATKAAIGGVRSPENGHY